MKIRAWLHKGERTSLGKTPVARDEGDDANGVLFFDDWLPDLKAAYDLRVGGG